jgi:hypothetical protein
MPVTPATREVSIEGWRPRPACSGLLCVVGTSSFRPCVALTYSTLWSNSFDLTYSILRINAKQNNSTYFIHITATTCQHTVRRKPIIFCANKQPVSTSNHVRNPRHMNWSITAHVLPSLGTIKGGAPQDWDVTGTPPGHLSWAPSWKTSKWRICADLCPCPPLQLQCSFSCLWHSPLLTDTDTQTCLWQLSTLHGQAPACGSQNVLSGPDRDVSLCFYQPGLQHGPRSSAASVNTSPPSCYICVHMCVYTVVWSAMCDLRVNRST